MTGSDVGSARRPAVFGAGKGPFGSVAPSGSSGTRSESAYPVTVWKGAPERGLPTLTLGTLMLIVPPCIWPFTACDLTRSGLYVTNFFDDVRIKPSVPV